MALPDFTPIANALSFAPVVLSRPRQYIVFQSSILDVGVTGIASF